jgi:hypothetical protein
MRLAVTIPSFRGNFLNSVCQYQEYSFRQLHMSCRFFFWVKPPWKF